MTQTVIPPNRPEMSCISPVSVPIEAPLLASQGLEGQEKPTLVFLCRRGYNSTHKIRAAHKYSLLACRPGTWLLWVDRSSTHRSL